MRLYVFILGFFVVGIGKEADLKLGAIKKVENGFYVKYWLTLQESLNTKYHPVRRTNPNAKALETRL